MKERLRELAFQYWVLIGLKWFGWCYIDIYAPGQDKDENAPVVAITFSTNEEYVEKISDLK